MEAPVTASQGAMRSLPMKLESLLSGPEKGLRAEEKKKLRILQSDLQGLVDNYLLEPSEVESPASTASSWMEGVRDLSYDIDDFIYELAHVAGGGARINVIHKPPRFKISRFPEKLRRRQWIVDDISLFRTRVKETIRRYRDYLGSNCKWRPSSGGQPPPASPSGDTAIHLVGVDTYIKQLCSWLTNDGQPEHKVASIVGAGGVGKTTLAKQVYRMLGGQFECLAFVRTSTKADMKGLLTSILSQVRRQKLPSDGTCDVHSLVLNIKKHLQYKTYLIVIEDLWALSTWDLVDRSLPKGNCCSRILTTTEVEVIALACCADNSKCIPAKKVANSRYIIKKEPLSEDESRELFLSTAFGKQAECPQHLREVSDEIIKIIGGLPLAINILAKLLSRQPASSIEQWNYIKNSLSSGFTANASLERVNQVLNLGYDNLPHCLKACMLYLCLYEEGCIIWKDDLVKQWIAEDFIGTVQGDDGEEVARSYFGELVNRGMIQPVDIDCNDEILSCTVHHMVLHFIRDKSMEENFCIALDHSQTTIRLADKVRRLALHFGNLEDATPPGPESMRLSKVRSVAFSGFLKCMPSIVEFRFLQVLILKLLVNPDKMSGSLTACDDLSGNITEPDDLSDNLSEPDDLGYNLTGISELFRLRYFHLDACHMSVALPTKMQQLKDLVAWEIDAEVTAVSSDIVDLPGLLYLSIPSEAHLPTGIGRMTSLRTLGVFDLSNKSTEHVMSLGELTNLQELRLTCSTLQPANLECLGLIVWKLRNLKRLTLVPSVSTVLNTENDADSSSMSISWLHISTQPLPPVLLQTLELSRRCCIFSTLPEWTKELTNLCILKIAVRKLSKEDVAILKGLPSLTALSLFILTAPASRIMFDYEGFSVLKYFKFVCAAPCLAFLIGAMPKVRKVKLGFNANRMKGYSLDAAGFRHLTGLNEISIKIGGTGVSEHNRRSTQSVLTTTIGNHPSTPIINVQWVDWNFCGDDVKYIDEHGFQEKNFEEDTKKQADIRTYMTLESTLHPQTTDGTAEKHEDDSGGYGEIYKAAAGSWKMGGPGHWSPPVHSPFAPLPPSLMAASPTPAGGIGAILAANDRDYLVRNSGEQVKISSIEGDTVAIYFSASWCPPCQKFTPKLIEAYKELASHGKSFEVVFVSGDVDEESFNAYFAKMPWLAVPFSDSEGRKGLNARYEVTGIPHLVFLDAKTGEVLTDEGVEFVREYGVEAYPFTAERINELKEQEKAAKDNQTIHSLLGTPNRDYVISNKGEKVPIVDLEGKYVGLCYVMNGCGPVEEFTKVLAPIYGKLKEVGEKFEVVAVSLDSDEAAFNENFSSMPWLAIPQGDRMCEKLVSYFELSDLPTLVLIGPDGKTLNRNIADIINEHGLEAWEGFPFTAEKLEILAEKAKAKAASQTLESLLVAGDLDFVIGKDGAKVPVAELVGKTVLLYFSAKWCGPCRAFLPTLVDLYNKIKEKNSDFEIIFISSDREQGSFDEFFSNMPWLALPLEDERKAYLKKKFKIRGIPSLIAIGPDGKTVNTDAKTSLAVHGADAFPFTDERIQGLEKKVDEMAKGWPEKLKHKLHEHELTLTRHPRQFVCDGCDEMGASWSYHCAECDFDLHAKCALGEEKKGGEGEKGQEDAAEAAPAGYVCEGDVCRKA